MKLTFRIRNSLLCILLLLPSGLLNAQKVNISVKPEKAIYLDGVKVVNDSYLYFTIRDSLTKSVMPGADIILYSGKDSLCFSSNYEGNVNTLMPQSSDSLRFKVSFMGYKTAEGKFKRVNNSLNIRVLMVEDPAQLAAVIISGDKVSMVIKGDTTVFNAAAFFSAEDSPLRTLLSQMPGIELKNNSIIANGESVSKILLNGKAIFGNDINSALNLMYSKDVKSVKVYDQYDQNDYTIKDSLDRKERVLDIISKVPLNKVSGLKIGASVSNARGYSASSSGAYYDQGKPTVKFDAQFDKSPEDPNNTSSNSSLNLKSSYHSSKKRLNTSLDLNYSSNASKNKNSQITEYNPSELFDQKSECLETLNDDNNSTFFSSFALDKTLKNKRDKFVVNIMYSHTKQNALNSTAMESIMNGESISLSNTDYLDSTKMDNVTLSGMYIHKFSKIGRKFSINVRGDLNQHITVSDRRDLSPSSTNPVYLDMDSKDLDYRFFLSGYYCEPITDKLRLNCGYSNRIYKMDYTKYAFDHILNYQDMLNSAAYSQSSVNNKADISLKYLVSDFDLILGFIAEDMTDRRLESIPAELDENKHYFHISPSLRLAYTSSLINVKLNYSEYQLIPELKSLRSQVDNSNLMHLSAGNPSLRQSINRGFDLTASITLPKIEANVSLSSFASFVSDYITSRIIYFTSDTTLPDYNYTFPEGSDLRVPVNVDGKWAWNCALTASKRFSCINSTLSTSLSYKQSNTPYYKQDLLCNTLTSNYAATFTANCFFSSKVSLDMNAKYEKVNSFENSLQTISTDIANAWGTLTVYPLKQLQTSLSVSCDYLRYSNGFPANFNSNLAATISYSFGKADAISIGLSMDNILNSSSTYSFFVSEDQIINSQSYKAGRSLTLFFRWRLK